MKALRNNSSIYTKQIISAITVCYSKNAEPSNGDLMKLYAFIGQNICEQGEKAFVVHLAQTLAEQLPQIKGFSPRNLRRMRNFYHTYQNQPELMNRAQTLGWTQNTVILECCETDEQRVFYICLAAEQNLSKLALVKAIKTDTFKPTSIQQNVTEDLGNACPAVSENTKGEAVDTAALFPKPCGAFVTACGPLRQGSGLHISNQSSIEPQYEPLGSKKGSLPAAIERLLELPIDWRGYPKRNLKQIWQSNRQPVNASPPNRWWRDFGIPEQSVASA